MARKFFCRPSKHFTHVDMTYWAQGGMCHVHDSRDQSHKSIPPKEFLKRAEAIGRCVNYERFGDARTALVRLCNQMAKVADWAFFQGDPTDDQVSAWKRRHRGVTWVLNSSLPDLPPIANASMLGYAPARPATMVGQGIPSKPIPRIYVR